MGREEGVHRGSSLGDEVGEELAAHRVVGGTPGFPALLYLEEAEAVFRSLAAVAVEGGECFEKGKERSIVPGLGSKRGSTFTWLPGFSCSAWSVACSDVW